MSMTASIASYILFPSLVNKYPSRGLFVQRSIQNGIFGNGNKYPYHRPRGLFVQRSIGNDIVRNGNRVRFPGNQSQRIRPRDLVVYAGIPPAGASFPSGPPPDSWRNWIVGAVITLILPFFTHKWGPLQIILKRIDNAVEMAEEVTDAIEAVAKKVDKVAEDLSDGLPEGGKLRKAADFVEDVAERIAKDTHLIGDIIDEVEELEEKVESFIEPVADHDQATKAAEIPNPNAKN